MPISLQSPQADARLTLAAETAFLPVTPEMAWTVPQLLKRVQLICADTRSTTGVLRGVLRMPQLDEQFVQAFTDSGFLSCDEAIARVRWKYDVAGMEAKYRDGSGDQVLAHCRSLLARHGANQPFDWNAVLLQLRTLNAWFPELRTVDSLAQLYGRLHVLHADSVHVARCWLDRPCAVAWAFQGVRHA